MTQTTATKTPKPRRRNGVLRVGQLPKYVTDLKLTISHRVAHYLNWATTHRPFEIIPYGELTREVLAYDRLPRKGTHDVELVKSAISQAKKILFKTYNRGIISARGYGVRATVNADDRITGDLTVKVKKLQAASDNFVATKAAINPAEIVDPKLKEYFNGPIKRLHSDVTNPLFIKQFARPEPDAG